MDIDKLYNIIYKDNDSKSLHMKRKEQEAYIDLMQAMSPLKNENAKLYNEIQQAVKKLANVEHRDGFKDGLKTGAEMILSTLK